MSLNPGSERAANQVRAQAVGGAKPGLGGGKLPYEQQMAGFTKQFRAIFSDKEVGDACFCSRRADFFL